MPEHYYSIPPYQHPFKQYPLKSVITELVTPFQYYVSEETTVSISDDPDASGGYGCLPQPCSVMLAVSSFLNPAFPEDGKVSTIHELFHAVFNGIRAVEYARQHSAFKKTYRNFVRAAGYRPYSREFYSSARTGQSPLFNLVDESSYIANPSSYGHPYSNHRELFASTLTVTSVFPEQFLDRLKLFSDSQKRAVATVYFASISILLTFNENKDNLNTLLPNHERIANILLPYKTSP